MHDTPQAEWAMTGFGLEVRLDMETGLATAELLDADGVAEARAILPLDGTMAGFLELWATTQQMTFPYWEITRRQWIGHWPAATVRELTIILEGLARELNSGR